MQNPISPTRASSSPARPHSQPRARRTCSAARPCPVAIAAPRAAVFVGDGASPQAAWHGFAEPPADLDALARAGLSVPLGARGWLCVLDKPGGFDDADRRRLLALAAVAALAADNARLA